MNKLASNKIPRIFVFTVLFAVLAVALIYNRIVRIVAVPDSFQYIPKEHSVLITTGGLENLLFR